MKLTIRLGNSYWNGTISQVAKWAKEPCYNELQRNRQKAALAFLAEANLLVA